MPGMPDSPKPLIVRVIEHSTGASLSSWIGDFGPPPAEYSAGSLADALAALPTTVAAPAYDRAAVLEQIEELTNPRKQFVARAVAAMEAIVGPEPDPAADVEAWLKRELAVSYARHMAEFDADMIFGPGRDGRDAGRALVGIVVEHDVAPGDPSLFGYSEVRASPRLLGHAFDV
jgi:hypothetical protein